MKIKIENTIKTTRVKIKTQKAKEIKYRNRKKRKQWRKKKKKLIDKNKYNENKRWAYQCVRINEEETGMLAMINWKKIWSKKDFAVKRIKGKTVILFL